MRASHIVLLLGCPLVVNCDSTPTDRLERDATPGAVVGHDAPRVRDALAATDLSDGALADQAPALPDTSVGDGSQGVVPLPTVEGSVAAIARACDSACSAAAACTDPDRSAAQLTCYATVAAAFGGVVAGGRIVIRAGVWAEGVYLRKDNVEVVGADGAHLRGVAVGGKAALVVQGDDVVVRNLECSQISVPDENGACIRAEGRNLTLDGVHFHDSEQGLLGGAGELYVLNSTFERLGRKGYAHGIYVGRPVALFVIHNSRFLSSKSQGHEVKSRAAKTVIQQSTIAALSGVDSRTIDIPNGGVVILRGNTIHQGPNSANSNVIGIGLEGVTHAENAVSVQGNWIVNDRAKGVVWLQSKGMPDPTIACNKTVGGADPAWGGSNEHFADRAAAELGAFPALPAPRGLGCDEG